MHHLFNIKPSSNVSIPDTFPLNKNKQIDCQTCHAIKDMKNQDYEKIDKNDDDFFRQGPYEKITDFCYRCHDSKKYKRDNIHKMLDKNNKIIKHSCLYCHEEQPDLDENPEKDIENPEIKLRLEPENICYGCHLRIPHFNALAHHTKADDEMKKRISKYEREQQIILPLSEAGEVMCITCHNPHQLNVIDVNKAAGKQVENNDVDKGITYSKHPWNIVFQNDKRDRLEKLNLKSVKTPLLNYKRIEQEILLRLPAKDGALCLACHEFEK